MMQLWDERYGSEDYVYGKAPNGFFSSHLEKIQPGKLLLPGEGEGRNAVYAAGIGWNVDAFDQSEAGRLKALSLAKERSVQISYETCQTEDFLFKSGFYDLGALIYFHASAPSRKYLHRQIFESLKPGGILILEAFHREQLHNNTGGPKSEDLLYDEETLMSDFASFEILELKKQKILLNEGSYHQGEAVVIRLSGKKPV